MSAGFALVPLDCPACGAPLAAEADDVVFYCTACRSGFRHDPDAPRALAPVEVAFVSAPTVPAAGWLPFWVLPARLEILRRDASGAFLGALWNLLTGEGGEVAPADPAFVVPAGALPIEHVVALTVRYTTERLGLGERLGERLTGGVLDAADAAQLARYALITVEAEKSDTLRDLDVRLDFGPPRLLGVPWVTGRGGGRVDALFGLPM
ncbi:MAG TPA: hypothetical protein VHM02_05620 [Thermoanaerobaculia bacterium]|nr:hypothetical protein [Thermoanaerobaculia bacterium]